MEMGLWRSLGRCLHAGSVLKLRMRVLFESAGSMGLPLFTQSALSVTVSPSLSSTPPGFIKGHEQVGYHGGDTCALLSPSSATTQVGASAREHSTHTHTH